MSKATQHWGKEHFKCKNVHCPCSASCGPSDGEGEQGGCIKGSRQPAQACSAASSVQGPRPPASIGMATLLYHCSPRLRICILPSSVLPLIPERNAEHPHRSPQFSVLPPSCCTHCLPAPLHPSSDSSKNNPRNYIK